MNVQIGNKKAERLFLESKLRQGNPGDELSVEKMEEYTGRKCGRALTAGHQMFLCAAKFVENDTRGERVWRWQRDRKVYRCLLDEEKPSDIRSRTKEMRRKAKRNAVIISGTDLGKLTTKQQVQIQVDAIVCALFEVISNPRTLASVEREVPRLAVPSPATIVDMMRKRESG